MRLGTLLEYLLPMVASLTYAIPVVTALRSGLSRLEPPLRIIALYCVVTLLEGCVMIYFSLQSRQTLWLIHLYTPVEVLLLLLAFAGWQVRSSARAAILIMIPAFAVAWAALLFTTDSLTRFPVYGRTVAALLIIAVAAYTLVVRSHEAPAAITKYSWFWVAVALLMYFPYVALLNPLSEALHDLGDQFIFALYRMNAILMIVSNLLLSRAILCQKRQFSGGSSSPQPLAA